ncbi:nuclear transport factor 2 family protein [Umezawaea endophytica]|uniref:Nuclear transport factor 2 family protein n=1 Tax=Umezawaea endophytica TaxID=1654476 RepID=A0A9X2VG08_9PSEU|nr:nuclear transport factor 2 family protein [Umezawaea endophytica]MCS7475767.1 nuclear transport factor 2 family protein [Umezawaea endophytica]
MTTEHATTPMSAERAVENLMARYSYMADAGDFAGLGALFADAEYSFDGRVLRGAEEVEAFARGTLFLHEDGTPRTKHVVTNILIEVDEAAGSATARAYYTVFQSLPDFPLQAVAGGEYLDLFRRTDGTWRFARRDVSATMFGDLSRLMDLPS